MRPKSFLSKAYQRAVTAVRRDQRGGVVVLVAAALVVLLGFGSLVLDYGRIAVTRANLHNATDAAALAGAKEYALTQDWGRTEEVAGKYLLAATDPDPDGWDFFGWIGVEAWKEVPFTFARVLGLRSATVRVKSEAMYYTASALRGVVPLAVPEGDYTYGDKVKLKVGQWKEGWVGPGNLGLIALGGTGADVYEKNLMYGYSERLAVGDVILTEPGTIAGNTRKAIDYRLKACPHDPQCTISHWESDCPRVLLLPVCETYGTKPDGRAELLVKGFAAFLVQEASGNSITGYFIKLVTDGEGGGGSIEPVPYGVSVVKLIS